MAVLTGNLATLPGVEELLIHRAEVRRLEAQLLARELGKFRGLTGNAKVEASWIFVQGDLLGCRTGNGEKLSISQAQPGQVVNSAVA